MIGGRPTWGMTHPDIMTVPPVFDEIDTLRTELAKHGSDTTAVDTFNGIRIVKFG